MRGDNHEDHEDHEEGKERKRRGKSRRERQDERRTLFWLVVFVVFEVFVIFVIFVVNSLTLPVINGAQQGGVSQPVVNSPQWHYQRALIYHLREKDGQATIELYKALDKEQLQIVLEAMKYAEASPWPELKTLEEDVFAP